VGARQKLNVAYFNACLIIAAVIGAMTGSGLAFLPALIALVAGGCASGAIRPRRRGEQTSQRSPRTGSGRAWAFSFFIHPRPT